MAACALTQEGSSAHKMGGPSVLLGQLYNENKKQSVLTALLPQWCFCFLGIWLVNTDGLA
jgi:hypothetical protein